MAAFAHQAQLRRHAAAQVQLVAAQQSLEQAHKLKAAQIHEQAAGIDSGPALEGPASVDAITHHLGQIASSKGLLVSSVRIEHQPDRAAGLTEVRIATRAQGEYGAVKAWAGELLALHRALALMSASLRRATPDQPLVDAEITFGLFMKSTP